MAGLLTIVNGQARYSSPGLQRTSEFEGTVGSQGELAMRSVEPSSKISAGIEIFVSGKIDGNGTVRARYIGPLCSYDLIWQKSSK
jgi:hypothetical protein